MCATVVDCFLGIVLSEEAIDEAGCKAVAAADPVEDLKSRESNGLVEFTVVPSDGGPVARSVARAAAAGGIRAAARRTRGWG